MCQQIMITIISGCIFESVNICLPGWLYELFYPVSSIYSPDREKQLKLELNLVEVDACDEVTTTATTSTSTGLIITTKLSEADCGDN